MGRGQCLALESRGLWVAVVGMLIRGIEMILNDIKKHCGRLMKGMEPEE